MAVAIIWNSFTLHYDDFARQKDTCVASLKISPEITYMLLNILREFLDLKYHNMIELQRIQINALNCKPSCLFVSKMVWNAIMFNTVALFDFCWWKISVFNNDDDDNDNSNSKSSIGRCAHFNCTHLEAEKIHQLLSACFWGQTNRLQQRSDTAW